MRARVIGRLLPLLAILPLLAALLSPGRAHAQPPTTQQLEQAVAQLAQFQGEAERMRAVVRQSVGPYAIGARCEVCVFSLPIIGCMKHETEGWEARFDLRGLDQVDAVLAQAQSDGVRLDESYAPTRAWIAALPAFSAGFGATADVVLAVQQQIRQGQPATDAQRLQVAQALGRLEADLARSADQLDAGVRALAVALQRQSDHRGQVRQALDISTRSAAQDLERATEMARHQRCQDGVPQQIDRIRASFENSTRQLAQSFDQLGAASGNAERSLAVLLGAVVDSRTGMQNVVKLVQAARNDQIGSFLEQLHLAAAKKQWEDLAAAQGRAMLAMAGEAPAGAR